MRNRFAASAFLAALMCTASAAAAASPSGYDAPRDAGMQQADPDGLSLRAGQFAWLPASNAGSDGPVTMLVNLEAQRAYLYRDGQRIAETTVSTGRRGHDTPTGVFPIMGKSKVHYSNRYNNAPMPYMQRLTRWGHALHAGDVRPYPASHGCIRLPAAFAKQLFALTNPGDLVIITKDDTPKSLAIALAVAEMDHSTALAVGVTEPLPHIVFYDPRQGPPPVTSVEGGAGSRIAF